MIHRRPVAFRNRKGHQLFGILEVPATAERFDLGVILLSPGVKMRVGPQGLYRRLSDYLVGLGLPVLRIDFYGLGDSEGTLTEELLRDVYNHIEVGRFVDDTLDAMNWMHQEWGTKQFILSGLCGGAITGLLAGSKDSRVAGLLALGITPVLASRAADASRYMTSGQLRQTRRAYVRRLLRPKSWARLLTLQSDYRLIWRFIEEPVRKRLQKKDMASETPPPETDNANPLFPPAFFDMLSSQRPMLLVFGGSDRLQWEFEEKFVARHGERLAGCPRLYEVHVVPQANHVLTFAEWQDEMLQVSAGWIQRHFASRLVTRHAAST